VELYLYSPTHPNGVDRDFFTLFDIYCTVGLVETAASASCNLYLYSEDEVRHFPQTSYQTTQRHLSENNDIWEQFAIWTAGSSETLVNSYQTVYRHIPTGVIFNKLKLKLYHSFIVDIWKMKFHMLPRLVLVQRVMFASEWRTYFPVLCTNGSPSLWYTTPTLIWDQQETF
jgi:hypothetical protein